jgi:DNA-binding NtrC family response regulator
MEELDKGFSVLLVDDEEEMCISLSRILKANQIACSYLTEPSAVLPAIRSGNYELAILDIKMPGLNGIELLRKIKALDPHLPIIMITGYASFENALLAMQFGAQNIYPKPLDTDKLLDEIRHHAKRTSGKMKTPAVIIHYASAVMDEFITKLEKVANTDVPVLITGETGTGKELAANYLHARSSRSAHEFVKLNCAAIPDTLIESELFGSEKGAFTGATNLIRGKFEIADKSSIFLDEIGDMSLQAQAKILRILQEKVFIRLGGAKPVKIDTRIIAATNKDLLSLIKQGSFREDLYYRLSVVTIEIPPLRKRKEDILHLSEIFVAMFNEMYQRKIKSLSPEVADIFLRHDWPGNIRELRNCIERMVIFCDDEILKAKHLPAQYMRACELPSCDSFQERSNEMTREIILDALYKTNGSKQKAAELLKISRKTLYNNMRKLGMK